MKILEWFKDFLGNKTDPDGYDFSTYRGISAEDYVEIQAHALFTIIDLIATLLSKCEIKVYRNGKEYKKELYDTLNFQPNKNQNAVEWKKELFTKLLYRKSVLVVEKKNQFIIADSYNLEKKVMKDYVFSEVTREDFTFANHFAMRDVLFCQYENVMHDKYLQNLFDFYSKLMSIAAAKYRRSGEEKGVLKVSARAMGDPNYEETFKELMGEYFKEYFAKGNTVLPLFEGYDYNPGTAESTKKYSNEITDVRAIFEEALMRAAQAYKVPMSLVRGDVASVKDSYDIMLTNCIDPLADQVSKELTIKLYSAEERIRGCNIIIDTTNVKHNDLFDIASGADKLIASGMASIDEVRHHAGLEMLNEDWSQQHYITKNYATADVIMNEGGETKNEQTQNSNDASGTETIQSGSGDGDSEEDD